MPRQPGQAVRFVEHEVPDELLQTAHAFQRFRLAEQLLGGVGGADADGRIELGQILGLDLGGEPPVVFEHTRVETSRRPTVTDILDIQVAVAEHIALEESDRDSPVSHLSTRPVMVRPVLLA